MLVFFLELSPAPLCGLLDTDKPQFELIRICDRLNGIVV
jgi:hypothetical protein